MIHAPSNHHAEQNDVLMLETGRENIFSRMAALQQRFAHLLQQQQSVLGLPNEADPLPNGPTPEEIAEIDAELAPLYQQNDEGGGYIDKRLMRPLFAREEERAHLLRHARCKAAWKQALTERGSAVNERAAWQAERDAIISANLRLAKHICKRFAYTKISYNDLYSAAICGMLEALDRFDLTQEVRYATYATWWIRQQLQIAACTENLGSTSTFSPHVYQRYVVLMRHKEIYADTHGGAEPTNAELSTMTGIGEETIAATLRIYQKISLDAPLPDGDGETISTLYADPNGQGDDSEPSSVLRELQSDENIALINTAFNKYLRPRERTVLRARFLGYPERSHETLSLRQIGSMLGISKERVRQVQNVALKKLRHAPEAQTVLLSLFGDAPLCQDDDECDDDE